MKLPLTIACALALAIPAGARADTLVTFDDHADDVFITGTWAGVEGGGRGVDFAPTLTPATVPRFDSPYLRKYAGAPSAPNVLDGSGTLHLFGATPGITGHFSDPRAWMTVEAGDFASGESADITLTAYSLQGDVLAAATHRAKNGSPDLCNFCPITLRPAGGRISYFTVTTRSLSGRHIAIDDLRFERPTTPIADFAVAWTDGAPGKRLGLRQGATATATITTLRTGGYSEPVQPYLGELPLGITGRITPAWGKPGSWTVTLTAAPDATVADFDMYVHARSRTMTIPVSSRPPFAVAGDGRSSVPAPRVDLAPCTTTAVRVPVVVPDADWIPSTFTGSVYLTVDGLPGLTASIAPQWVTPGASAAATLTLRAQPGALIGDHQWLLVSGWSAPYTSSGGHVLVHPVAGTVTGFSTPTARRGSTITIYGTGFCPGALVSFRGATVAPAGIDASGRSITVKVPSAAVTGAVTVQAGGSAMTSTTSLVITP